MVPLVLVLSVSILLGVGTDVSGTCNVRNDQLDINWASHNAQSILFLEHLQRKATEEDLYEWKTFLASDDYQMRLRQIESEAHGQPIDDCGSQDVLSPTMIMDRLAMLEERLVVCSGGGPIAAGPCFGPNQGPQGGEILMRKMTLMQNELRRQRAMIQRMNMQMSYLSTIFGCTDGMRYTSIQSRRKHTPNGVTRYLRCMYPVTSSNAIY